MGENFTKNFFVASYFNIKNENRSHHRDVFFRFVFGRFDLNDLKISLKELIFQSSSNKHIAGTFRGFSRSCRNSYTTQLKLLWPEPCRVIYLSGIKIQDITRKYSENFVDYFPPSKNRMTESVSTQKLFQSIVVHSKPPIERNSICYYELGLLKVEIRLIYEKKKINLNRFLINFNSCFTKACLRKTITTSKMKPIDTLVDEFQPLTNATKNSISGVAGVLDPPL